jgi:hypothetical protein
MRGFSDCKEGDSAAAWQAAKKRRNSLLRIVCPAPSKNINDCASRMFERLQSPPIRAEHGCILHDMVSEKASFVALFQRGTSPVQEETEKANFEGWGDTVMKLKRAMGKELNLLYQLMSQSITFEDSILRSQLDIRIKKFLPIMQNVVIYLHAIVAVKMFDDEFKWRFTAFPRFTTEFKLLNKIQKWYPTKPANLFSKNGPEGRSYGLSVLTLYIVYAYMYDLCDLYHNHFWTNGEHPTKRTSISPNKPSPLGNTVYVEDASPDGEFPKKDAKMMRRYANVPTPVSVGMSYLLKFVKKEMLSHKDEVSIICCLCV